MHRITRPVVIAVGVGLLLAPAVGCAHVKRSDMETELARLESDLRDEYRAADSDLEGRITAVDGRVDGLEVHLADLDARTASLENDLQSLADDVGATVQRLENAIAFNAPVHFEYDSAEVRAADQPLLERFAEVVRGYYPHSLITVEGFTDPAGSPAYNRQLGLQRAESVKQALVASGVEAQRLRAVSYGEDEVRQVNPGAWGPGTAGMMNRRVALVIETSTADWDVTAGDTRPIEEDVDRTGTEPGDSGDADDETGSETTGTGTTAR